jgi:phosphate transport system permease protein
VTPSASRYAVTEDAAGKERAGDRLKARVFQALMFFSLALGIITLAVLLIQVLVEGWPRLDMDLLTHFPSRRPATAGAQSAIFGTIWLMGIVMATSIPLGFGTAIYLEEYADPKRWYNRLIELNIQNLAAVPSIVYGILGLAFLVRGPLSLGHVVLAAGLTLALLVLPVVVIAGREAIRAVPPSIREGSMALGATKWQTIWKQVLPACVPGFATGVILAVSRAIGEAAPLIVVGGATYLSFYPSGLGSDFTVLPLQIFNWISQPQEEFKELAAAGMIVLLAILLLLNAAAIWLRNKYEKKW